MAQKKFQVGDRVRFGGPNWATGYEIEPGEPGSDWVGTVVREDEDAGFESYYVRPDPEWCYDVMTEDDGTASVIAVALTLLDEGNADA